MNQFQPRISQRFPSATLFAEIFQALGPRVIASEDARLPTHPWLLLVNRETLGRELYRLDSEGEWERVFVPGHPVIDQPAQPEDRRHSLAFDQADQPVVAFERGGMVLVTRWDTTAREYVQNVSFSGVDPTVFFDATVTDAGMWPIEVVVEWLPTGQWFTPDEVIADSDVLVFYLSMDRQRVLCRVQRQLFLTVHELHDYGQPVILDRAITADGRYQLLVSDARGNPLEQVLLSAPYVGELMLLARHTDDVLAGVALESIRVQSDTFAAGLMEGVSAGVNLEAIRVGQNGFVYAPKPEGVGAGVQLESVRVASSVYVHRPAAEFISSAVDLEDIEVRVSVIPHAPEPEGINAGVSLEAIRVQKVS